MRLAQKIVLLTGGSRGIGEAITRLFAREGATVAFCGRDEARGERVAAEVTRTGGRAEFTPMDCSEEPAVEEWVRRVIDAHGRIDGVVNNAGIAPAGALEDLDLQTWNEVLRVNVTSMFLVNRAAIPHLRAAGGGAIVNLGSTFGVVGSAGAAVYAVTKAAAISLSKSLALELAPDGIRVNALCPGGTETPFTQAWLEQTGDPETERASLTARHPIGRLSTPQEQAAAALFLISDDASFVTGHALLVDGGYTAI